MNDVVLSESQQRLAAAWSGLLTAFLPLAGGLDASGVAPWYEAAGGTLAVTLGMVSAATGEYRETDLAAIATRHGVPLVVATPTAEYARLAGLEADDTALSVTLEHLPYLLFRLHERDVDNNPLDAMSVAILRDRAFAVIQASCQVGPIVSPFSETAWGHECFEMEQRKGVAH